MRKRTGITERAPVVLIRIQEMEEFEGNRKEYGQIQPLPFSAAESTIRALQTNSEFYFYPPISIPDLSAAESAPMYLSILFPV